ncbi:MAG: DNA primase large subunit PriL [Candidatus Thorarchaeota archaeon]|nr:MAG: DNA primase large subunit PriL [Candidatus Thorarchaeota archaeon]
MLTRIQMLQYPFSVEARRASQKFARDLRDLSKFLGESNNRYIVEEAGERVLNALDRKPIRLVNTNDERDVLIYPTARLIVEKIGNVRLRSYQAVAESKSVRSYLSREKYEILEYLAESAFGWELEWQGEILERSHLSSILQPFEFKIAFQNFLQVAPKFHHDKWKLVNRHVDAGMVYIAKKELERLISGKFNDLILESTSDVPTLPTRLTEIVQSIETELTTKIRSTKPIEFSDESKGAFPPCISIIYAESVAGKNLSHEARFALAAFLLKIGMSEKEVMGVFKAAPDYVRSLAEYQVRHISSKSAGEGYTPPACDKMQGNHLCPVYLGEAWDDLCEYVLHPLDFYQTRAWELSKNIDDHSWYSRKREKKQKLS